MERPLLDPWDDCSRVLDSSMLCDRRAGRSRPPWLLLNGTVERGERRCLAFGRAADCSAASGHGDRKPLRPPTPEATGSICSTQRRAQTPSHPPPWQPSRAGGQASTTLLRRRRAKAELPSAISLPGATPSTPARELPSATGPLRAGLPPIRAAVRAQHRAGERRSTISSKSRSYRQQTIT